MNNFNNIPTELKKVKRWVIWRKKKLDNGKITKQPICADTGYGAKSNDESTWTTYERALDSIDLYGCDGLGFMLGDGYMGIDIDHAIENKDLINEFIETLKSYTEKSQSGTGIHIICKGKLPKGARRKGNIEFYDSLRFFVMTGDKIGDYVVQDCTETVKPLYNKYLNSIKEAPKGSYVSKRDFISEKFYKVKSLTDDEVIAKAKESKNGAMFNVLNNGNWEGYYPSQSEADAAFLALLAFWTNKDINQMDRIFRRSGLMREKWDRKTGEGTYGSRALDEACKFVKSGFVATEKEITGTFDLSSGELIGTKKYPYNDTGNALRFVDKYGDVVRYNTTNKWWMIWDGKTWIRDEKQIIKVKADILIDDMRKELAFISDNKELMEAVSNIKHLSNSSGKEAMLKEAQHIDNTAILNKEFDVDKYLLNCENGVIDLKTGLIMPHDKKYMLSKNTHIVVDMENEPKLWIETLQDIFLNSNEMVDYIQKALGYSLTGSTKEQCFFQCYGTGSNGKSMFFNIINSVFGDYAIITKVDSILTSKKSGGGNASPDIARLNGARFAKTEEPNENSRLNEGLVKELTGGGSITARFLYAEDFEFKPIFKLWIACNYKLVIRGTDKGIWRRQRVIPFNACFEGKNDDKDREVKLLAELPQILGWCIKGGLKWQKEGLEAPREILEATEEYKEEMDIVESFITDNCKLIKSGRESAKDMYNAYKDWAKNGNEYMMGQKKFAIEMGKKFKRVLRSGYNYYVGIILKKNDTSYVSSKGEDDE